MSTYLIGSSEPTFVTGRDGTVTLVPGGAAAVFADLATALAAGLVSDDDTIYSAAVIPPSKTLSAALVPSDDTIVTPNIARATGGGLQHARPDVVGDAEAIYAAAVGRVIKPSLVTDDDTLYATSATQVMRPALVPGDDAVPNFVTTLFVQPSFVADADAIPAADVGWKVFAEFTADADAVYAAHDVFAYNDVLPDTWFDEETLAGYPFKIQSLTGGIPVPRQPGILTGSLNTPPRLTGSIKQVRLTGSIRRQTGVLTGSIGNATRRTSNSSPRKR